MNKLAEMNAQAKQFFAKPGTQDKSKDSITSQSENKRTLPSNIVFKPYKDPDLGWQVTWERQGFSPSGQSFPTESAARAYAAALNAEK